MCFIISGFFTRIANPLFWTVIKTDRSDKNHSIFADDSQGVNFEICVAAVFLTLRNIILYVYFDLCALPCSVFEQIENFPDCILTINENCGSLKKKGQNLMQGTAYCFRTDLPPSKDVFLSSEIESLTAQTSPQVVGLSVPHTYCKEINSDCMCCFFALYIRL